jgi:hypothetical protein
MFSEPNLTTNMAEGSLLAYEMILISLKACSSLLHFNAVTCEIWLLKNAQVFMISDFRNISVPK